MQTPEQGADGIMYVAISERVNQDGGSFYANCSPNPVNPVALSREVQEELYKMSRNICGIANTTNITNNTRSQGVTVELK